MSITKKYFHLIQSKFNFDSIQNEANERYEMANVLFFCSIITNKWLLSGEQVGLLPFICYEYMNITMTSHVESYSFFSLVWRKVRLSAHAFMNNTRISIWIGIL